MVLCRQKLAPFLDDGFVHKDRRVQRNATDALQVVPKLDTRADGKIKEYKFLIKTAMQENKIHELETIINEVILTTEDSPESHKIYTDLRMDIIHGMICVARYFKYKKDLKERRERAMARMVKIVVKQENVTSVLGNVLKNAFGRG